MSTDPTPPRLHSLDAYRGFIMLAMASSGFGFARIYQHMETAALASGVAGLAGSPGGPLAALATLFPERSALLPVSPLWSFLGYQFDHVAWIGCSFWDLIQPSFMFMVGVAMPYSLASRESRGDSYGKLFLHAVWRALVLILLAVFLSSPPTLSRGTPTPDGPMTNWVFTNVLAQIGLGYVFVFLLAGRGLALQFTALLAVLVGTTLLFGLYPAPGYDYPWSSVKVPAHWPHLTGWFSHWDKNSNVAHFFDLWFLNLFPRVEPFIANEGGYQTLNFIPSMGTMILGLMAGELLRREGSQGSKFAWLAVAAVVCLTAGWLMGQTVCPIVKRIWTPSWVLFSAGWTFAILATFYAIIDIIGWKAWSFPLIVVGMNSIAMYCMSQQLRGWVRRNLHVHIGRWPFVGDYSPLVETVSILLILWLICFWMYRRRIFIRI